MSIFRKAVAVALVSAVPLSTASASVRPSAAVPTAAMPAATSAVAAQATYYDRERNVFAEAWPIFAYGAAMLALVAIVALDDDDEDSISPG